MAWFLAVVNHRKWAWSAPNGSAKKPFVSRFCRKSGRKTNLRFDPIFPAGTHRARDSEFDELAWWTARAKARVARGTAGCRSFDGSDQRRWSRSCGMSMDEKREIGVILGTGGGAQEFSEEQYRLWHSATSNKYVCFAFQRHNGDDPSRNQHALRVSVTAMW